MFNSSALVCDVVLFPWQCPTSATFHCYSLFCDRLQILEISLEIIKIPMHPLLLINAFEAAPLPPKLRPGMPAGELASEVLTTNTVFGGAQDLGTQTVPGCQAWMWFLREEIPTDFWSCVALMIFILLQLLAMSVFLSFSWHLVSSTFFSLLNRAKHDLENFAENSALQFPVK